QGTGGTINDCLNYGYVKAINAVAGGAGILGVSQNTAITMENCTNYGVVSAAKKSSGTINEKIVSGWNGSCEPTPTNCADKSSYTTQMVGYQIAKVSDTNAKADLRIIASVDSANHTNVGFNVVVKDANGNEVAKVENYKCKTVYRNLSALGVNDAISASAYRSNGDADDGYLFAIVIQDLPVEKIEETYYFEITTFVDGEATNCDTASFGVAQPAQSGN
ncbi:MAG: hypothetical protein IJX70_03635, partial [Clostridia bacterium]|nr:hypothetical protein [Clostridia bacterium]